MNKPKPTGLVDLI